MLKTGTMEKFNQHYEISTLVLKHLRSELNTAEHEKLEKWLLESDHNRKLFEKITNQDFINPELILLSENDSNAAWKKIEKATKQDSNIISVRRNYRKIVRYAAVIALLIVSAALLYQIKTAHYGKYNGLTENDIPPGGNKATLTLANGTKIALDDVNNGELARQQNVAITKTAGGQIVYHADLSEANSSGKEIFNTISTPRGGQYQLILPDGTKVWLNSMSSLKFPAAFTGKERRVELSGEGYFEVSKNKEMPFTVKASEVDVRVLGTQFNISAYEDEKLIKTTLIEGSVKIARGNHTKMLVPGMQAICDGTDNIKITDADAGEAVAWKNGYFLFRNEPIEDLMLTISRWYDVDVKYEGSMEGKVFGGKFSKKGSLSELLKSLELTGTVKFKAEGRRITAMP